MSHQILVRLYTSIILFITVPQRLCEYFLPFLLSEFSFNMVLKSPPRRFLLSIFLIVGKNAVIIIWTIDVNKINFLVIYY